LNLVTQEQTHDALRHSPTEPEITTATKEHNRNSETKKRPRFPAPQAERSCRKLQKPTVIGCTTRGWQTWSQRRWLGLDQRPGGKKKKTKSTGARSCLALAAHCWRENRAGPAGSRTRASRGNRQRVNHPRAAVVHKKKRL
jgi:hypothetical protein